MARPVTLFTGQWADLDFKTMCAKARDFGYDGLELACWGDHFDVTRALQEENYCQGRWDLLNQHGLKCFALSNHLVGQATCDNIDSRHQSILPEHVWGDGDPEGVRQRAAADLDGRCQRCRIIGTRDVRRFFGEKVTQGVEGADASGRGVLHGVGQLAGQAQSSALVRWVVSGRGA